MSLVTSKEMLNFAKQGKYAVGAFNAENMEMVQAIVKAAEELNAPVIIQTTPTTVKYASALLFANNVAAVAKGSKVPIAIHLDHGESYDMAVEAMIAGYTSVMIDGSKFELIKNIEVTKKVVDLAKKFGIPVEAELGKLSGKEDNIESVDSAYTDPSEAVEFIEKSGIDSLAIAIGTAHGIYKGEPKLDVDRLIEIKKIVNIPLVLHGASGLSEKQITDCVKAGICKVNFATELRIAFTDGVKEYISANPSVFDPKKYLALGREKVVEIVKSRMIMCGCNGKA